MPRASHALKAKRLNRARSLLRRYPRFPDAVQRLAETCSISSRQAYRYLEQAQHLKHPVPVSDPKIAFTVKLVGPLVRRLRRYAARSRLTLSDCVTRALLAMLGPGRRRG
jgi:predicted DNA-binding transcriptional regulator YafY